MIGPDPKPKVACVAVRVNSVETVSEGGPHSSPSKPSILRDTGIENVKPKKSIKFVLNNNTCHSVPAENRVGQFRSRSFTRDKFDKYFSLQDQDKAPLKDTPPHAYKIAKANAKILENLISPYRLELTDLIIVSGSDYLKQLHAKAMGGKDQQPHSSDTPPPTPDEGTGSHSSPESACPAVTVAGPTEWLADTGCAYDLVAKEDLPKRLIRKIFQDMEPVSLHTANGIIEVSDKVSYKGARGHLLEPYVLDSSPPIISIGKRCMNHGWSFIWKAGRTPYFILPNGDKLKLRLVDDVPYFVDRLGVACPAKNVPSGNVGDAPCVESQEPDSSDQSDAFDLLSDGDEVLDSDEVPLTAGKPGIIPMVGKKSGSSPNSQASGVGESKGEWRKVDGQLLQVSDTDKRIPVVEIKEGETLDEKPQADTADSSRVIVSKGGKNKNLTVPVIADDSAVAVRRSKDLRKEAKSIRHLMTHFPKNPYCKACQIAKATDTPCLKTGGSESAPKAEKWGDHCTADHIDSKEEFEMGVDFEKHCLIFHDVATKETAAYPSTHKNAIMVTKHLRDWQGKDKIKYLYTDDAPEFEAAKSRVGIIDDNSLPGRHPSNGKIESQNRRVLNGTRTLLEHAGLHNSYWPHASRYWSVADSITPIPSAIEDAGVEDLALPKSDKEKEMLADCPYTRRHGKIFGGIRLPFGCLVNFIPCTVLRRKKRSYPKWGARAIPGIFMGWHLAPGSVWRGDYKVAALSEFKSSGKVRVQRERKD